MMHFASPGYRIEQAILLLRGEKVMLDADLAALYGVTTKRLNEQVTRNRDRFPADFSFRLTRREVTTLRPHFATANWAKKRYPPRAFTEHGILMLSSVLRSDRAVQVNIAIMRAFVRLRRFLSSHEDLARKLAALESKYDAQFKIIFDAIRALMAEPDPKKPRIGFRSGKGAD